ncbi:MAG: hypothetical protein AB7S38_35585 [Vulcanimicrobiota bacterium]
MSIQSHSQGIRVGHQPQLRGHGFQQDGGAWFHQDQKVTHTPQGDIVDSYTQTGAGHLQGETSPDKSMADALYNGFKFATHDVKGGGHDSSSIEAQVGFKQEGHLYSKEVKQGDLTFKSAFHSNSDVGLGMKYTRTSVKTRDREEHGSTLEFNGPSLGYKGDAEVKTRSGSSLALHGNLGLGASGQGGLHFSHDKHHEGVSFNMAGNGFDLSVSRRDLDQMRRAASQLPLVGGLFDHQG